MMELKTKKLREKGVVTVEDVTIAWQRGSMVFEMPETNSAYRERFVSKKNEPPSSFFKRILMKSKNINGESVFAYLKDELKEDFK